MASFNPDLTRRRDEAPDFVSASKGRRADTSLGTLFSGLADAAGGVIKAANEHVLNQIEKTASNLWEAEVNDIVVGDNGTPKTTTPAAGGASGTSSGTGVAGEAASGSPLDLTGGRDGPDTSLSNTLPGPLKAEVDRFARVSRASRRATGRISPTSVEATAWALMKKAQAMYPGYEKEVAAAVRRAMGYDPVTATKNSFIREWNSERDAIAKRAADQDKWILQTAKADLGKWARAIDMARANNIPITAAEATDPAKITELWHRGVGKYFLAGKAEEDRAAEDEVRRKKLADSRKLSDEELVGAFRKKAHDLSSKTYAQTISKYLHANGAKDIGELIDHFDKFDPTKRAEFANNLNKLKFDLRVQLEEEYSKSVRTGAYDLNEMNKSIDDVMKPLNNLISAVGANDKSRIQIALDSMKAHDDLKMQTLFNTIPEWKNIKIAKSLDGGMGKASSEAIAAAAGRNFSDDWNSANLKAIMEKAIANPELGFWTVADMISRDTSLTKGQIQSLSKSLFGAFKDIMTNPDAPLELKKEAVQFMFSTKTNGVRTKSGFDLVNNPEEHNNLLDLTLDPVFGKAISKMDKATQQIYKNFMLDGMQDQTRYGKALTNLANDLTKFKDLTVRWDGSKFYVVNTKSAKQEFEEKSKEGRLTTGAAAAARDQRAIELDAALNDPKDGLPRYIERLRAAFPEATDEDIMGMLKVTLNKRYPKIFDMIKYSKTPEKVSVKEKGADGITKTKEVPAKEISSTGKSIDVTIEGVDTKGDAKDILVPKDTKASNRSSLASTKTKEDYDKMFGIVDKGKPTNVNPKAFGKGAQLQKSSTEAAKIKTAYGKVAYAIESVRGTQLTSSLNSSVGGRFHMGKEAIAEGLKKHGVPHRQALRRAAELLPEFKKGKMQDVENRVFEGWTSHNIDRLKKAGAPVNDVNKYLVHVLDREGIKLAKADNNTNVINAVSDKGLDWMKGNRRLFTLRPEDYTVGEIKARVKRIMLEERIRDQKTEGKFKKKEKPKEKPKENPKVRDAKAGERIDKAFLDAQKKPK